MAVGQHCRGQLVEAHGLVAGWIQTLAASEELGMVFQKASHRFADSRMADNANLPPLPSTLG